MRNPDATGNKYAMPSGATMTATARQVRAEATPAVLTQGFRPFFLAAGLWSIIALTIWIVSFATGSALPSRFDPLSWHIHEMLFGFVMATIAGFLLTAIPNWTRRLPISGLPLALLVSLWLLGRLIGLVSSLVPFWLAAAADLSFPVVLVGVAAREIVAGRNWRNLPMVMPVALLGVANLLMHLETDGFAVPFGLGWRLGLAAVIILISVVAGRIIPSFTRNWLAKRGASNLPSVFGIIDRVALGILHLGLLGWAFDLAPRYVGALLLLGAALNLWRLLRWRGSATGAEPLLLILHIGYGWLVIGAALLGLTTVGVDVPLSASIHTLTVGAVGTMILAVMTRTTLGHTGRSLSANRTTELIYVLVGLAAAVRLAAAFNADWSMPLLIAAACFWIGGFGLFLVSYGPFLLNQRDAH
jgi:uncharacterized protein involved in response to NO